MGNHDCYTLSKTELAPFFLGEGGLPSIPLRKKITPVSIRKIFGLYCLDTARDRDYERYDGFVSQQQLQWLASKVEEFNTNTSLKMLMVLATIPSITLPAAVLIIC